MAVQYVESSLGYRNINVQPLGKLVFQQFQIERNMISLTYSLYSNNFKMKNVLVCMFNLMLNFYFNDLRGDRNT